MHHLPNDVVLYTHRKRDVLDTYIGLIEDGTNEPSSHLQVCIIFSLVCLMPLMALVYLLVPHSKLGRILRTPFMKFMYHSASFGVFLVLLILASTNVSTGSKEQRIRQQQRGPPPTKLELVITLYVLGEAYGTYSVIYQDLYILLINMSCTIAYENSWCMCLCVCVCVYVFVCMCLCVVVCTCAS